MMGWLSSRRVRRLCAASTVVSLLLATSAASADGAYTWKADAGETHGSQVASSEWLPIFIGGAAGVIVGGLVGQGFDDRQPPVFGALTGAALGGLTGGAGGAWLIRDLREQDTRFAASVTGLGVGGSLGVLIFAKTITNDNGTTKAGGIAALVILPVMGAFMGRSLAITWGTKKTKDQAPPPPAPVSITPTASPIMTAGMGTTGMTFGIDGAF
jgi:hypothetical protein